MLGNSVIWEKQGTSGVRRKITLGVIPWTQQTKSSTSLQETGNALVWNRAFTGPPFTRGAGSLAGRQMTPLASCPNNNTAVLFFRPCRPKGRAGSSKCQCMILSSSPLLYARSAAPKTLLRKEVTDH